MEALFISTGVVALAEIGDKTQLLAFILAARFKKPLPIIAGILCATLVNHGLAGALGTWTTSVVSPEVMRWALGLSFIGMAVWTMIPDKIEEEETQVAKHLGVFGATFITFFLAEMGDKTQIATVALAAHYAAPLVVIAGTTLGMLLADVPAVLVGNKFAAGIPMQLVHSIAAGIFALMGLLTLLEVEKLFHRVIPSYMQGWHDGVPTPSSGGRPRFPVCATRKTRSDPNSQFISPLSIAERAPIWQAECEYASTRRAFAFRFTLCSFIS